MILSNLYSFPEVAFPNAEGVEIVNNVVIFELKFWN